MKYSIIIAIFLGSIISTDLFAQAASSQANTIADMVVNKKGCMMIDKMLNWKNGQVYKTADIQNVFKNPGFPNFITVTPQSAMDEVIQLNNIPTLTFHCMVPDIAPGSQQPTLANIYFSYLSNTGQTTNTSQISFILNMPPPSTTTPPPAMQR